MPLRRRWLVIVGGGMLLAFLGGFVIFAASISRDTPKMGARADGIVVLTGGEHRLVEAARLLAEGRGKRLLISGANRVATPEDLHRKSGLNARLFQCCVDIGYAAHDTVGNADETRAWVKAHGFSRVIIVTSNYHMPRTLTELGRTMPRVALVPHPVVWRGLRTSDWWMQVGTLRLLFSEYVKFLPSAARYGLARVLGSWDDTALANSPEPRAARG